MIVSPMGQPAILDKLQKLFNYEIKRECEVVYVLVEMGKLLEQEDQAVQDNHPTVNFYRNWVVHARLDRNPFAVKILEQFDEFVSSGSNVQPTLEPLLKSQPLRNEMRSYLQGKVIAPFLEDDIKWKAFVKLLSEVILDVPLTVDDGTQRSRSPRGSRPPKKAIVYVRSLNVTRARNSQGVATLTWTASFKQQPPPGSRRYIDVTLFPGDDVIAQGA
jgi:hypothetical protein